MALAVAVQVLVWGAPSSRSGGALLARLRPDFGTAYAVVMLLVELGMCLVSGFAQVAVWVLGTGAVLDLVFWVAHAAGLRFAVGAAAAMTAAFGSVGLNAGLWRRTDPEPTR